jgi:hypothetical protein
MEAESCLHRLYSLLNYAFFWTGFGKNLLEPVANTTEFAPAMALIAQCDRNGQDGEQYIYPLFSSKLAGDIGRKYHPTKLYQRCRGAIRSRLRRDRDELQSQRFEQGV